MRVIQHSRGVKSSRYRKDEIANTGEGRIYTGASLSGEAGEVTLDLGENVPASNEATRRTMTLRLSEDEAAQLIRLLDGKLDSLRKMRQCAAEGKVYHG